MNTPYFNNTGLPAGSVPMRIARSLKLTLPINRPIGGMMTSATAELTILPNGAPITTPTARSMTLPFIANSLNSEARLMGISPCCGDSYASSAQSDYENPTKGANDAPGGVCKARSRPMAASYIQRWGSALKRQRPSSYERASALPPLPSRRLQLSSYGGGPSFFVAVGCPPPPPRGRAP